MRNKQDFTLDKQWTSRWLVLLTLLVALLLIPSFAQQGGATYYTYDDNGRLRGVIAPSGEGNIYEYDAAGNITAIRKLTADTPEIFDFLPRQGAPGTQVTIIGTGFGAGVSAVSFNGVTAQIVSVNAPQLVVTVPTGATTGPVSVITSRGAITSAQPFIVRGITLTPAQVTISSEDTQQFTATTVLPEDANVVWSVNGVIGGSASTGTITNGGLYKAPLLPSDQARINVVIGASSAADNTVTGMVILTIRNKDFVRWAGAPIVSVRNGVSTSAPITTIPFAQPVSVRNGATSSTIITTIPFAQPVSVRNGNSSANVAPLTVVPFSSVVSVTTSPVLDSFTLNTQPINTLSRNTNNTLKITGKNLTGVNNVQFFSGVELVDTTITVTNVVINTNGTELTASVAVGAGTPLGRRFIVLSNGTLTSIRNDLPTNRIEIVP